MEEKEGKAKERKKGSGGKKMNENAQSMSEDSNSGLREHLAKLLSSFSSDQHCAKIALSCSRFWLRAHQLLRTMPSYKPPDAPKIQNGASFKQRGLASWNPGTLRYFSAFDPIFLTPLRFIQTLNRKLTSCCSSTFWVFQRKSAINWCLEHRDGIIWEKVVIYM